MLESSSEGASTDIFLPFSHRTGKEGGRRLDGRIVDGGNGGGTSFTVGTAALSDKGAKRAAAFVIFSVLLSPARISSH